MLHGLQHDGCLPHAADACTRLHQRGTYVEVGREAQQRAANQAQVIPAATTTTTAAQSSPWFPKAAAAADGGRRVELAPRTRTQRGSRPAPRRTLCGSTSRLSRRRRRARPLSPGSCSAPPPPLHHLDSAGAAPTRCFSAGVPERATRPSTSRQRLCDPRCQPARRFLKRPSRAREREKREGRTARRGQET